MELPDAGVCSPYKSLSLFVFVRVYSWLLHLRNTHAGRKENCRREAVQDGEGEGHFVAVGGAGTRGDAGWETLFAACQDGGVFVVDVEAGKPS
jgi:hypothetical protein